MKAKYESPTLRIVKLTTSRLICVSQIGEGSGEGDVKAFRTNFGFEDNKPIRNLWDEEW